jgi:hypothetical protein
MPSPEVREKAVTDVLSIHPVTFKLPGSIASSPRILTIRKVVSPNPARMPYNEPSSKGAPKNIRIAPRYMGCRTNPYTPVDTTFCFRSSWILTRGDRNVLSAYDRKNRKNDPANRIPPITFNQMGKTGDHPNRFASRA